MTCSNCLGFVEHLAVLTQLLYSNEFRLNVFFSYLFDLFFCYLISYLLSMMTYRRGQTGWLSMTLTESTHWNMLLQSKLRLYHNYLRLLWDWARVHESVQMSILYLPAISHERFTYYYKPRPLFFQIRHLNAAEWSWSRETRACCLYATRSGVHSSTKDENNKKTSPKARGEWWPVGVARSPRYTMNWV